MIDKLIEKIKLTGNPSVIGLDTRSDFVPPGMSLLEFNCAVIDKIKDIVPAVKVQIACYEMYGIEGLKAFAGTLKYAKESGLIVMTDAKRGDIGSTAENYSSAFFGQTDFESDFLTVNGYLGSDGVLPFVNDCKKYGKGIFVLVKTSNPSSAEVQDKITDGMTVYERMAHLVNGWGRDLIGKHGYSSVGAVVGATYPEQAKRLREMFPSLFFLVPGYGAQGGTAADAAVNFDKNGLGAIINSSRAILTAYKNDRYRDLAFDDAAREAAIEMRGDLRRYI